MNDQPRALDRILRLIHSTPDGEEPAVEGSGAASRSPTRRTGDVRPPDAGIRRLVESLERIRRRGLLD